MEDEQTLGVLYTSITESKDPQTSIRDDYADSAVCSDDSMPRFIDFSDIPAYSQTFPFKSQLESIKPNQTACDICLGNVQRAAKYCRTCSASFCVSHLADHYKAPAFSSHELGSFEQTSKVPLEKDSPINLSISAHTERRLVLLGKTGSGKSVVGNNILGREAFKSEPSPLPVTKHWQSQSGVVEGRNITIIDTPGIASNDDAWLPEMEKASLGPHIFLLVINLSKFTENPDNSEVQWIQRNLGEEALKFTIVLFTGEDLMNEKSVEDFLRKTSGLRTVLDCVEGEYYVFNNSSTDCNQVTGLIKKIDSTLVRNMGYVFTHEQLKTMKKVAIEEEEKKTERQKYVRVNKTHMTDVGRWMLSIMIGFMISFLTITLGHKTYLDDPLDPPMLRLMMLGKVGSGKSASGNTILGREAFKSETSALPVTTYWQSQSGIVEGRNITVIDTPGITLRTAAWISEKEKTSLEPHMFLLVINLSKYTENTNNSDVGWIQGNLGEQALKFTIVLFTGGDLLDDKSVEEFLNESPRLQTLVNSTGGGYHIFRNKHLKGQQQVKELLAKIEAVLRKNWGYSYSSGLHEQAKTIAREDWKTQRMKMEGNLQEGDKGKILEMYDVIKRIEKGMENNTKQETEYKAQRVTNKTTTSKGIKKEAAIEQNRSSLTPMFGLLSVGMLYILGTIQSEFDLKLQCLCFLCVISIVKWDVIFVTWFICGVIGLFLIYWVVQGCNFYTLNARK